MQQCRECKETLPTNDSFYARSGKSGRGHHTSCKSCMQFDQWSRRVLALSHPRPGACETCGNSQRRLEIDHDHKAAEVHPDLSFRGWICHSCNNLARRPGRSTEIVAS